MASAKYSELRCPTEGNVGCGRAPIRDSAVTCSIGFSRYRLFPSLLSSCSPQFRALTLQIAFATIPSSRSVILLRKVRVSMTDAIARRSTQQLDALSLTRAVYPARLMESCALCCVGPTMSCDTSRRPVPPAPSRASTLATSFSRVTYACSTSHTHTSATRALYCRVGSSTLFRTPPGCFDHQPARSLDMRSHRLITIPRTSRHN